MARSQGVSDKAIARVAAQIGSTLLEDNEQWVNRFQVKSTTSSSLYTVAQRRSDGVWGCSCRGWTHYRHCKHLTDVLERLTNVKVLVPDVVEDQEIVNILAAWTMLASARTAYLDLKPAKAVATPAFKGRILDLE